MRKEALRSAVITALLLAAITAGFLIALWNAVGVEELPPQRWQVESTSTTND